MMLLAALTLVLAVQQYANAGCVDTVTWCNWYTQHYPDICTNSMYKGQMTTECSKTCNLCVKKDASPKKKAPASDPDCKDREGSFNGATCEGWKSDCTGKYGSWIRGECPLTCDACWTGPCSLAAGPKKDNTMCLYPSPKKLGAACGDTSKVKRDQKTLFKKYREKILETHNTHRQKVENGDVKGLPKAKGTIPDLKWDKGLALVAQTWLNQCIYDHDKNRVTKTFRSSAGQNLYISYQELKYVRQGAPVKDAKDANNKLTMFEDAVNAWYSEVKDFKHLGCTLNWSQCVVSGMSTIEDQENNPAQIGHFTQVIWAKTTHVGCGWIQFQNDEEDRIDTMVACNYGPSGNMRGDLIYT